MHLLLPDASRARTVRVNGRTVRHTDAVVEQSAYADARFSAGGNAEVVVHYDEKKK
jgi:hypothetical protein